MLKALLKIQKIVLFFNVSAVAGYFCLPMLFCLHYCGNRVLNAAIIKKKLIVTDVKCFPIKASSHSSTHFGDGKYRNILNEKFTRKDILRKFWMSETRTGPYIYQFKSTILALFQAHNDFRINIKNHKKYEKVPYRNEGKYCKNSLLILLIQVYFIIRVVTSFSWA